MLILVMGVAGSGKTTVGRRLASALGWEFIDADEFHPAQNKAKMAAGIPLADEDRRPWFDELHALIASSEQGGRNLVLACSALKKSYRDRLASASRETAIVYLKADRELIRERLLQRQGHYFPTSLLESQFIDLEEPESAIAIAAELRLDEIVAAIRQAVKR
ncbi:MAG TPA: gluconokinase [Burkholderiales bacterium]|nr:gluconokinase [Burkholderiales bacterium]